MGFIYEISQRVKNSAVFVELDALYLVRAVDKHHTCPVLDGLMREFPEPRASNRRSPNAGSKAESGKPSTSVL
jgi:hypothetical protein